MINLFYCEAWDCCQSNKDLRLDITSYQEIQLHRFIAIHRLFALTLNKHDNLEIPLSFCKRL
jgi:hypothetical protein